MVAIGGKRFRVEPAVDGLDVEACEAQHQEQLVAVGEPDLQVVRPAALPRARVTGDLVEEAHLHELRGRVVAGEGEAVETPAAGQVAGEVVAQRRPPRLFRELLRGEGRDLDAEQAAGFEVLAGIAQKSKRVIHGEQAQKRVEGADGEAVAAAGPRRPHVAGDPTDIRGPLPALLNHPLRRLHRGYFVPYLCQRRSYTPGPGAPLDYGALFAIGEGEPEGDVVVVIVFEIVEVREVVVLGQNRSLRVLACGRQEDSLEGGPMIEALDHVQVAMPQGKEDEARAFYSGLLGLNELEKPATLVSCGGAWFSLPDGHQLHLGAEEPFRPSRKAHPAFIVASPDELARKLEKAGLPVRWDDELAPRRRFYGEDPFGNRMEFMQRL